MNITEIYAAAKNIAKMPRRARRLHVSQVLKANPGLNPYDFNDIVELYLAAH